MCPLERRAGEQARSGVFSARSPSPSSPAKTIEANSGHPLASWLIVALWLSCAVFIVEKWKVPEAVGAALSGEYNAEPGTFPWEAI